MNLGWNGRHNSRASIAALVVLSCLFVLGCEGGAASIDQPPEKGSDSGTAPGEPPGPPPGQDSGTPPLSVDAGTPPRGGSCGLASPAFCETFDKAYPGGRGGDLDENRFSFTRLTSNSGY